MFKPGDWMNSGIFFKKGQVEISEKSPGGGVSFSKKKNAVPGGPTRAGACGAEESAYLPAEAFPQAFYLNCAV